MLGLLAEQGSTPCTVLALLVQLLLTFLWPVDPELTNKPKGKQEVSMYGWTEFLSVLTSCMLEVTKSSIVTAVMLA